MRCSWPGRHEHYRMGLRGIRPEQSQSTGGSKRCADSHGACGSPRCVVEAGPMDEIICVFGHFPKALRTRTLEGVKTAVKPGGYFLTEVYSPYQIPYRSGDRKISNFIRARGFPRTLCRLADCPLFMGEVVRHEGQGHQGLSHVIQFAGQKPLRT